jgi:glucose/arabinose dehydrogenase
MAKLLLGALALLLTGALGAAGAQAASLQPVGTFDEPVYVTSAPSEPNRLFVAERSGRVMQVRNGVVSTFADARPVVDCCVGDRGLNSIAIAPDFASSGRFYLHYSDAAGNIVIGEMRASGGTAPLSSLRAVMTIPFEPNAYHYGGQIEFGPEGALYIATGDGGFGGLGDEHHNGQNLGSLLGKILRIDPLPNGAAPYSVPAGNPFPGAPAPYDTIWAYGLRNPWRFSFDPLSAHLVIADVGEEIREEVNALPLFVSAGVNFGWNCLEGREPGPATDPECALIKGPLVPPIFEYGHKQSSGAWGCAVIGGYVVRDPSLGDLNGRYIYADFCTAAIRSFSLSNPAASDRSEGLTVGEVTSFGRDSCGRIYVVARSGAVSRLVGSSAQPCLLGSRLKLQAAKRRVKRGAPAKLTVWVAPCEGRQGEKVTLYRGKRKIGTKALNKGCSARFHPRIGKRGAYRVRIGADPTYDSATSRRLVIAPLRVKSK